jgi:phage tail sheath protein FI
METFRTPGVYVREVATLPPSVAEVSTAIPAFLGYTERGAGDVARITSMLEFQTRYGGAKDTNFKVTATNDATGAVSLVIVPDQDKPTPPFLLHYSLSHYFLNGGGPCWVISIGKFPAKVDMKHFTDGLARLEQEDEPTLILFPDAIQLQARDYYALAKKALAQCNKLKDRFAILDVPDGRVTEFRDGLGTSDLSYGAAYHPYLRSSLNHVFAETRVTVEGAYGNQLTFRREFGAGNGIRVSFVGPEESKPRVRIDGGDPNAPIGFNYQQGSQTLIVLHVTPNRTSDDVAKAWTTWTGSNQSWGYEVAVLGNGTDKVGTTSTDGVEMTQVHPMLDELKTTRTALYNQVLEALGRERVVLPPSAAVAGVYASVDRDRGVWKAPANVSIAGVIGPVTKITDEEQGNLNIDVTAGKSINAIRDFTGKGTLVWGARTLAGNDNEWRYVPVRRLFLTIEESAKKASAFCVFEPNDAATWLKVKGMIESYLYGLWERGALAGAKPEAAYYVNVGLGRTMTPQDVLEGRLIVEIGIAAVRPAEFIILRFMHKLQEA